MTTIATDGKVMACDSCGGRSELIISNKLDKITRLADGSLLGLAGRSSVLPELAAWLGGKGKLPTDCGEWSALHLTEEGCWLLSSDGGRTRNLLDTPAAIGSGGELALGAMLAGAGPQKAVVIASKRDPFTGGPVQVKTLGCS